ncbi:hypothetical protein F5B20DRAFT_375073 [Whalleya microplaca]|nr:hypothetical protein F5B20DRAFT_375073 [Whalleya microplaca]
MSPHFTPLVIMWTSVCLFVKMAAAGSMASWRTGPEAPQIIMQDDATGKIFYSLCNSEQEPIFPANESIAFEIDNSQLPKPGTQLGGSGYQENGVNVAAVQWQDDQDQIVHALFNCNMTTGLYDPAGSWIISTSLDGNVHSDTGLASVVLSSDAGIRVYYQDKNETTSALKYTKLGGWVYNGAVSQDAIEGFPIGVGFTDVSKISVVTPRDGSNIEVSTLQKNETWIVTTFPTPLQDVDRDNDKARINLPTTNDTDADDFKLDTKADVNWSLDGWDGKAGAMGLTLDSHGTRSIFYIGNDSALHQVTEANGSWNIVPSPDETIWPLADAPNAQFSTTYDFSHNEIWIFYMSGGNMTQVHQLDQGWQPASTLLKFNGTATQEDPPQASGLSGGARAGIGVGASIAGVALLALGTYIFLQRKKGKEELKKAEAEAEAAAAANQPPSVFPGSPAPAYSSGVADGQWVDGQWVPTQPYTKPEGQWQSSYAYHPVPGPPPVFEMPNQEFSHEMPSQAAQDVCNNPKEGGSPRELPTSHD